MADGILAHLRNGLVSTHSNLTIPDPLDSPARSAQLIAAVVPAGSAGRLVPGA